MESFGVIGAGLAGVLFSMTVPTGLRAYLTCARLSLWKGDAHPSRKIATALP